MLNRVNCLNDPINAVDPSGLFLDDAFSSRPHVYGDMWQKEYSTPEPSTGPDLSRWTTPDYDRINAEVNWWIDKSDIEGTMNAGPWHPIHWEKDAIWFTFYPFMNTEYDFFEPWGHPFFPDDDQDNKCK